MAEEDLLAFRESQHRLLRQIYNHSSLYLWGGSTTGKLMTITQVFFEKNCHHIVVNCIELFTPSLIFNHIISEIYGEILDLPAPEVNIGKNISLFFSLFEQALQQVQLAAGQKLHIVFKNADRLVGLSTDLMPFLLLLPEKTGSKVSVVFVSRIPFNSLAINGELACKAPLSIHFENYTKEQFIELMIDAGIGLDESLCDEQETQENRDKITRHHQTTYCKAVVYSVMKINRDLREMIKYGKELYPIYRSVCRLTRDESHRWRVFHGKVQEIFEANSSAVLSVGDETATANKSASSEIQLPYLAKFLMLAAYISSFNPPKTDPRFFCKVQGRMTKKQKTITKNKAKKVNRDEKLQILGPKAFNKERWFNIFEAILPRSHYRPSMYLESACQSLCHKELLIAQKCPASAASTDKFVVNINFEMALEVARSVNFELGEYLWDLQA